MFSHPPLITGVDSIRLLTVAPGDFLSPLRCTLTSVAFSDKPKYVALSYTWGSSYPENAALPVYQNDSSEPISLMLDDEPFYVAHNLHLFLLHLRSATHAISVWADAICINQADILERNQQVALMSFIYTRASRVVVWLGTKEYPSTNDVFRLMSLEWRSGQTVHFAAGFAGQGKRIRSSPKPTKGVLARLAKSGYWTRVWIVQEMCLPRLLTLFYGSDVWDYEDFRRWILEAEIGGQILSHHTSDFFEPMKRLLQARKNRHSDFMSLENLIERFAANQCSELRDRVYGLLGCAHDVSPYFGNNEGMDALDNYIASLSAGDKPPYELRRGTGCVEVDYTRSYFDIWSSVVKFVFFQARDKGSRYQLDMCCRKTQQPIEEQQIYLLGTERQRSIVRTACVVQHALGQQVEEELATSGQHMVTRTPLSMHTDQTDSF
ncbi:HET-domain-containing protein [Apiospora saccharicola]|uniref:HET-domain-containing protein n=1 Tax=Apiospora saccharicola TaxID=335842 RepID=A0ABR1THW5_9PEZI